MDTVSTRSSDAMTVADAEHPPATSDANIFGKKWLFSLSRASCRSFSEDNEEDVDSTTTSRSRMV